MLIDAHVCGCVQVRSVVEKEMGRPMSAKDICSVLDHGTTSEAHMYLQSMHLSIHMTQDCLSTQVLAPYVHGCVSASSD